MGDISAEPSMEDILSSIKRIIADEGESAIAAGRQRRARAMPLADSEAGNAGASLAGPADILELREPLPSPRAAGPAAQAPPLPRERPVAHERGGNAPGATAILSDQAAQASRGALDNLSRLVVKSDASDATTLEGLVREMLRPMLRDWLEARLPAMVEAMVAREIERITRQQG